MGRVAINQTKEAFFLFVSMIVTNILNYGFQIIMGRLLSVTDYGTLNALLSVYSVAAVPVGAISYIVAKYIIETISIKQYNVNEVFSTICVYILCVTASIFGFLCLLLVPISKFLHIENYTIVFIMMLASALGYIAALITGSLQGLKLFMPLGFYTTLLPFFKLFFGIIFVLLGFGITGAMFALVVGCVIALLIGITLVRRYFLFASPSYSKVNVKVFLSCITSACFVSFFIAFLTNIDIILVKHYFTSFEAGLYSPAAVLSKIILYIPNVVTLIMFPVLVEAGDDNKKSLSILIKALFASMGLSVIAVVMLNMFPQTIVQIIFGFKFIGTILYFPMLSIMVMILNLLLVIMTYALAKNRMLFLGNSLFIGSIMLCVLTMFIHDTIIHVLAVITIIATIILFINLYIIFYKDRVMRTLLI